ncbi:MAG: cpcT1 [Lacunisphaera sp.]|nr:cpcT1 [Lacunisphaera sp.]
MRFFSLILVFLLIAGHGVAADSPLDHLAACLTGAFHNTAQSRGDQNFPEVELHIAPIWTDRTDGRWFYLEQSLAGAPEHPYKQLVYQLTARPDGAIELRVFDPPNPLAATGAWKNPSFWLPLAPGSLSVHEGCIAILRARPDGSFQGATEGKGCASTVRGVSYATMEFTVSEKELVTWERGYNASGAQVWGSLHGGYEFRKP